MKITYRDSCKGVKLNQLITGQMFRTKDGNIYMKCTGRSCVGTSEVVNLNIGEVLWFNDKVDVEVVEQVGTWEVEDVQ